MNFVKGSLLGIALGTALVYANYDKIESAVRVSKRKMKTFKRKHNYSMI